MKTFNQWNNAAQPSVFLRLSQKTCINLAIYVWLFSSWEFLMFLFTIFGLFVLLLPVHSDWWIHGTKRIEKNRRRDIWWWKMIFLFLTTLQIYARKWKKRERLTFSLSFLRFSLSQLMTNDLDRDIPLEKIVFLGNDLFTVFLFD